MTPAATPMIKAPRGSTKPEAGVIATSPATAPEMIPSTLGFPFMTHSANIHASAAAAVAIWVCRHGHPGIAVGCRRRAGVEAEPADPQQRGADDAQHEVVRRHRFGRIS